MQTLMRKTSGNAFLGQSRKVSFSYFPKVALDHGDHGGRGCPGGCPLAIFNSSPMQHLRWSTSVKALDSQGQGSTQPFIFPRLIK